MDRNYTLDDIAMMTGFSTRTLRNYLNQGILKGEKTDGKWQFTAEEIDRFFAEPFVKEDSASSETPLSLIFSPTGQSRQRAPA